MSALGHNRTHAPRQTSGRAFPAVTFVYLSVECSFYKFNGIDSAPSWTRKLSIASFIGIGRSPHQSITRLIASSTVAPVPLPSGALPQHKVCVDCAQHKVH